MAPLVRPRTFSACVPGKVEKPEILPNRVQIYGRKLNIISPQVLLGKHAFSRISVLFSFSSSSVASRSLYTVQNEIRTERRVVKDDIGKRWELVAVPSVPSRSGKPWNQYQTVEHLLSLRPVGQSRTTQPLGRLASSMGCPRESSNHTPFLSSRSPCL